MARDGDFNIPRQARPAEAGQLVAYADQRAYTDRLNEVFGEWGWTRSYDVQVAQNFERRAAGTRNKPLLPRKSWSFPM